MCCRQQKELKERENELQTVVRELARMKSKFLEQQQDIEKKNSLSNCKTIETVTYFTTTAALTLSAQLYVHSSFNVVQLFVYRYHQSTYKLTFTL